MFPTIPRDYFVNIVARKGSLGYIWHHLQPCTESADSQNYCDIYIKSHRVRILQFLNIDKFLTKMTGYQTTDFSNNTCEVLKLYKWNVYPPFQEYEATIFHKPNGGEALWASLTRY